MAVSTFETMETKSILTIYDVHLLQSEDINLKLRGCDWIFSVEKASNESGDGINAHLERIFTSDDSLYGCIATVSIELKSYDVNVPSHLDHIAPREYSIGNKKWSLKPFISWDQLINPAKRFIDDNKILLEVKVKADKPRKVGENSTIDSHVLDPSGVEMELGLKFNCGSNCNEMAKKSNIVKCSSCFDDMFCQTLFVVQCGHLYCYNCIDVDLKQRQQCIVCGEPIDVDNMPPQIILFD